MCRFLQAGRRLWKAPLVSQLFPFLWAEPHHADVSLFCEDRSWQNNFSNSRSLGIKKKEIAHLVVIENILLGILAFVLAIPIGFLFSQFVSLVIVNLLGIPKTLFISLNFVSIGLLIIYFLTIYVLVLLNLLRRISKMTIRDFLYFDKQNEKKMFRDSKKRNVIFVLSIILGAISLFLWNSRCTMDNFNKQETLTYLMVSVIMLIISIYGISTTCADMFLTVILKFCIIGIEVKLDAKNL